MSCPRTWTITPATDAMMRPIEPGEECTIRNESGRRVHVVLDGATLDLILERDRLRDERDETIKSRDSAISLLGATSRTVGRFEGLLSTLADRLEYLENLWGAEGVTRRTIQQIRAAMAEIERERDDDLAPAGDAKGNTDG